MRQFAIISAALVLTLALGDAASAAQPVGRIAGVLGQATATRGDGSAKETLRTFSRVFQGDKLETGADGRLKVIFDDDSVVSLAPGSTLTVNEMVYSAQRQERRGLFSLLRGRVRAAVAKYAAAIKSKYEIATPTAVAGIRGTTLTMGTGLPGMNDYCALQDGTVEWCQGSNCITMPSNTVAQIGPDGKWVGPLPLGDNDFGDLIDPASFDEGDADFDEPGFSGDPVAMGDIKPPSYKFTYNLPNTDERAVDINQALNSLTILNIGLNFPLPPSD